MRRVAGALALIACALPGGVAVAAEPSQMPPIRTSAVNRVPACATPGRLIAYLKARTPNVDPRFRSVATHYMRFGEAMGLRWDYAFFQMLVETGSLTFPRGGGLPGGPSAGHYNFAGLGAAGSGEPGESFPDVETGVKAHLQHVLMYSGERIESPVAERTRKVQDWGILVAWQRSLPQPITYADLTRRWVQFDTNYTSNVEAVGRRFYEEFCRKPDPQPQLAAEARRLMAEDAGGRATGVELARAAVERARREGDDARAGLGAPPVAVATPPRAAPVAPIELQSIAGVTILHPRPVEPYAPAARPDPEAEIEAPPLPAPAAPAPVVPAAAAERPIQARPPSPAAIKPSPATPPPARVAVARLQPPPAPPAAVMPAPAPAAPPADPADEALRQLVSGKTVILDTALGTTVPILYRADGSMTGRAGSLAAFLGASSDNGKWWINKGRLCQRWNVWLDRETACMRLRQEGRVIHWVRDDGKSGTARLASQ